MTVIDPETQAGWVPQADELDDDEEMPLSLRLSAMPLENFFILHQSGECVFMNNCEYRQIAADR